MMPANSSEAAVLKSLNPNLNLGMFAWPADNAKDTTAFVTTGQNVLAASADTDHPKEARTFIDFVARPKQNSFYAKVQSVIAGDDLNKGIVLDVAREMAPLFKAGKTQLSPSAGWPRPDKGMYLPGLTGQLPGLFTGQLTVAQILAEHGRALGQAVVSPIPAQAMLTSIACAGAPRQRSGIACAVLAPAQAGCKVRTAAADRLGEAACPFVRPYRPLHHFERRKGGSVMRVDIHTHYFPQEYVDKINQLHPRLAHLAGSRRRPGAGSDQAELEMRFAAMEAAGVDMHVISSASNLPYVDSEEDAVILAREANDLFAEIVDRYPDKFRALAVLPLPHIDASLRELERVLDDLKMAGIIIGASVMGRSACEPEYDPIFEELNRRGAILFGHARQFALDAPLLIDYPPVNALLGPSFENTVFALHLVRRQIPQRFPDMKIIINHLGGTLPVLLDRMDFVSRVFNMDGSWVGGDDAGVTAAPGSMADLHEPPSVTLKRMYYETTSFGDVTALEATHKAFGVDQIMLGTDWPYAAYDYPGLVNYVGKADLPAGHAEKILGNAAQLLGLVEEPVGAAD